MSSYSVYLGKEVVGQAAVEKSGLYYKISCRCDLPRGEIFRLTVDSGEKSCNLGVLVPKNGFFSIEVSVPIKKLGSGELRFSVLGSRQSEIFLPITEAEEFSHLEKLRSACFTFREGKPGLLIKKTAP